MRPGRSEDLDAARFQYVPCELHRVSESVRVTERFRTTPSIADYPPISGIRGNTIFVEVSVLELIPLHGKALLRTKGLFAIGVLNGLSLRYGRVAFRSISMLRLLESVTFRGESDSEVQPPHGELAKAGRF